VRIHPGLQARGYLKVGVVVPGIGTTKVQEGWDVVLEVEEEYHSGRSWTCYAVVSSSSRWYADNACAVPCYSHSSERNRAQTVVNFLVVSEVWTSLL